jgi:antitoxin component of MazEF toxin-antitoxin module
MYAMSSMWYIHAMILSTLRRSGNSIVVTLPREALEEAGVAVGDLVSVTIRPVEVRPRLNPRLQAIADRIVADPVTPHVFTLLADA